MDIFTKFRKKQPTPKQKREQTLDLLCQKTFYEPHNQWIAEDKTLLRTFYIFFSLFDNNTLNLLLKTKKLIFLRSNGKLSCSLTNIEDAHIILIFPDLYQYMVCAVNEYAFAILAHELGHIIKKHSNSNLDPIQAQFAADKFVGDLGLATELIEILSEYPLMPECQLRIQKLRTSSINT